MISPFFKGALDTMTGIGEKSGTAAKEVVKKAPEMSVVKNNFFKSILSFDRQLIRLAGISGAIAVGLGAYGSHGKVRRIEFTGLTFTIVWFLVVMMNNNIPEEQKNSFRTASMYHFFGTFGIVAASLTRYPAVVRFNFYRKFLLLLRL